MSANCIQCVNSPRTGPDLLCDECRAASSLAAATAEVVSWAQAVLTALNVGDGKSGSKLHLKLRETMIAYRVECEKSIASKQAPNGAGELRPPPANQK